MRFHQKESEYDTDLETNSSFNENVFPDPTLDASILGPGIRLGQSEIGRIISLDADIYLHIHNENKRKFFFLYLTKNSFLWIVFNLCLQENRVEL